MEINGGGGNGDVIDGLTVSVAISSSAVAPAIGERRVVGGITTITAVEICGINGAETGVGPSFEAFFIRFALGHSVGFSPSDKDSVLVHAIFDAPGFHHAALRIRDFLENDGVLLNAGLRRARSATGENECGSGKKGEEDQFHKE